METRRELTFTLASLCFSVVESHPKNLVDLRIHQPFPELVEYTKTFDYSKMDGEEYAHIPAVVIVIKALEEWRASVS